MRRREFISFLAGAAAVLPLAARAQQAAMPVIGFLHGGSRTAFAPFVAAFRQGLSETAYVEGQNVAIEYRWAEGQNDRLPVLAADLVRQQVTVIATGGGAATQVAMAATSTIPIIFHTGDDPVESGLATSLNRPGRNLTGVSTLNAELGPKLLALLHELVPMATVIALLINPTRTTADTVSREMQAAARTLALQLHVLRASTERDLDAAFATLVQLRAAALVIAADAFFTSRVEQLAALATRHSVPAIYPYREFASAGGLMSYGASLADSYRLAGVYTGKILMGARPADLPIQQSTKVQLIMNLKTAKALGLTIPPALIARADEVIE